MVCLLVFFVDAVVVVDCVCLFVCLFYVDVVVVDDDSVVVAAAPVVVTICLCLNYRS
jgi:hypothetical protein